MVSCIVLSSRNLQVKKTQAVHSVIHGLLGETDQIGMSALGGICNVVLMHALSSKQIKCSYTIGSPFIFLLCKLICRGHLAGY